MDDSTIRVGVIDLGMIGLTHLESFARTLPVQELGAGTTLPEVRDVRGRPRDLCKNSARQSEVGTETVPVLTTIS